MALGFGNNATVRITRVYHDDNEGPQRRLSAVSVDGKWRPGAAFATRTVLGTKVVLAVHQHGFGDSSIPTERLERAT